MRIRQARGGTHCLSKTTLSPPAAVSFGSRNGSITCYFGRQTDTLATTHSAIHLCPAHTGMAEQLVCHREMRPMPSKPEGIANISIAVAASSSYVEMLDTLARSFVFDSASSPLETYPVHAIEEKNSIAFSAETTRPDRVVDAEHTGLENTEVISLNAERRPVHPHGRGEHTGRCCPVGC